MSWWQWLAQFRLMIVIAGAVGAAPLLALAILELRRSWR